MYVLIFLIKHNNNWGVGGVLHIRGGNVNWACFCEINLSQVIPVLTLLT